MKILANWLNEYLSTRVEAKTSASRLEQVGIEIEQIISSKSLDEKIIVGKVKKVIQHPNADRLKLVEVDTGKQVIHVVCGAPNVARDQLVALAQVGTVLTDGTEIKTAAIRGEESNGMLCSPRELGLSDDHSGILVLEGNIELGTTLCDIVNFGEILDLTTAANRPDLQSVIGLAREVAAQGGEDLVQPTPKERKYKVEDGLVGQIDKKLVFRYMLARVKLNKAGESPAWMQQRLLASGLRPINIVVDITNYVMLEQGQPLHAFDATNVALPVEVRFPHPGEDLITLDGVKRQLHSSDLLITDNKGPLALAGVMGGLQSQIIAETDEILLEAACFDGAAVRRMAVRHGLRTDASARFERNLPLPLPDQGLARALDLLQELCGATIISVSSQIKQPPVGKSLTVSLAKVSSLLGMEVNRVEAKSALLKLGFGVSGSDDSLELSLPWWRPDVALEEDVVEEIGRSLGYDLLPASLPAWKPAKVEFDKYWPQLWRLKACLRGLGFDEVVTYSFVSQKQLEDFNYKVESHLKLKNPLSLEQAYLRTSLAPSLVATVARNAHFFNKFGMFEISKVYLAGTDHSKPPQEPSRLGVVWRGEEGYSQVKKVLDTLSREFAQFTLKLANNPTLSPSRNAQVLLEEKPIGWIGEIHPDILKRHKISGSLGFLEIDTQPWLSQPRAKNFHEISRFPSIVRDLAIVLGKDVMWADIENIVQNAKVADVEYLSEYYGVNLPKGTKSVALRLNFSSPERTLTDAEADAGADKVMQLLADKFDAKPRV